MLKLKPEQKKVLEEIRKSEIFRDFYLAGGTCLLLRYGHRPSLDFDFFLLPDKIFSLEAYENNLLKTFGGSNLRFLYRNPQTLVFSLYGVTISLFEYPYPLLREVEEIKGLLMASDEDIACMKANAVSQMGLKKDFFDLWILMNIHRWNLEDLLHMLREKYEEYNSLIFLKALVYFEDAEKNRDFVEVESKWTTVKNFFKELIRTYKFKDSGK
ncbi:MAG: nucleotidyl transferase AbiEii/AbiGii toxin family protein [Thermotogae bacterium]|nr:nucleotidyl transferase AbiEii/AbiGii toxin family protein [Thermotogota bacterium]